MLMLGLAEGYKGDLEGLTTQQAQELKSRLNISWEDFNVHMGTEVHCSVYKH
jgi:hypothetical protein